VALKNSKSIAAENRRHEAIQMKMSGATLDDIAHHFKVSLVQIHRDIKRRLTEVRQDDIEAVAEEYALQKARYNRLLLRWWDDAIGSDPELAALATNQVLRIMRQLDYIGGLIPDKPLIQLNTLQVNSDGGGTLADLLKTMANDSGEIVEGMIADGNSSAE
jgi:hypothetical protein